MSKDPVSETYIGPPRASHADFYLPPRPATNLDAAELRITGVSNARGVSDRDTRVQELIDSLRD